MKSKLSTGVKVIGIIVLVYGVFSLFSSGALLTLLPILSEQPDLASTMTNAGLNQGDLMWNSIAGIIGSICYIVSGVFGILGSKKVERRPLLVAASLILLAWMIANAIFTASLGLLTFSGFAPKLVLPLVFWAFTIARIAVHEKTGISRDTSKP